MITLLLAAAMSAPVFLDPDAALLDRWLRDIPASLALQDKIERARALAAEAKEADKQGDKAEGRRLRAEGYALLAEHYHELGRRSQAEQAYSKARSYGWTEPAPWGGAAPAPRFTPRATPTPRAFTQDRPAPRAVPKPARVVKRDRFGRIDTWPFYELNPLKTSRNATWHSALGIPPMEEASGIPNGSWDFRMWIELQSSDFSTVVNGETTQYHADLHEESLELNYGLSDTMTVGGRITMGELLEVNNDVIRVFEGGSQIVPTGDRSYAVSELVLRGKWAPELLTFDFAAASGLIELKVPLAGTESLITAGTFDIAFIGLLTVPVMEGVSAHFNVGPVLPFGNSDLFDPEEDPSLFFTYAAGGALKIHDRITLNLQLEGNTSAWSDISVLDEPIMRVTAGGRWKAGEKIWVQLAGGVGLDEISGTMMINISADFTF